MKDRSGEDFSDVITGLKFANPNIVPIPGRLINSEGVCYNRFAKVGFKYVAAFLTICDDTGDVWIETFGIKKEGDRMILDGRYGSKSIGTNPPDSEINHLAKKMIKDFFHIS